MRHAVPMLLPNCIVAFDLQQLDPHSRKFEHHYGCQDFSTGVEEGFKQAVQSQPVIAEEEANSTNVPLINHDTVAALCKTLKQDTWKFLVATWSALGVVIVPKCLVDRPLPVRWNHIGAPGRTTRPVLVALT